MRYLIIAILVLAGFAVGKVFEKIILARLRKVAAKTTWEGDEIIFDALSGITTLWFGLASIHIALIHLPINSQLAAICNKSILVIVIFSATLVAARIAAGMANLYLSRMKEILPQTSILLNLTRLIVFTVGILIALQTLGISIAPILTTLGVGGVAVALALQDTLSNLFSGLQILVSKQVRPNDYVKLDTGEEGYVVDTTWRNTTIRTLPNNMVIIPNAKLASAIVTNYHRPQKDMAVLVQVGVSHESDLEKVEKVTMEVGKEVMKEVAGGIPEFEPFIRYHTFADFSINFTVILRTKEFVDQYLIKHEFIKRLNKRYRKENIEIPFPIRTVNLKDSRERQSA